MALGLHPGGAGGETDKARDLLAQVERERRGSQAETQSAQAKGADLQPQPRNREHDAAAKIAKATGTSRARTEDGADRHSPPQPLSRAPQQQRARLGAHRLGRE